MEAETCMRFAANVRESGFGLYSYLSSGKSSAIAISLRPTSFHCSMIAADGLKAGFGGSFALLASVCATTGIAARNATAHNAVKNLIRFIFLSSNVPVYAGIHFEIPPRDRCMLRRLSVLNVSHVDATTAASILLTVTTWRTSKLAKTRFK